MENDALPSAAAPDSGSAFTLAAKALRARGCKCPLMWSGVIPVPATICDQQPTAGRHCKVLADLPPVPTATSSDVRKAPEPTREAERPLDSTPASAGD